MLGVECLVLGVECLVLGVECLVLGVEYWVMMACCAGCWVLNVGC